METHSIPGEIPARIATLFDTGGPVMVILFGLSIIAMTIVLLKIWQFARAGINTPKAARSALAHWRQHDHQAALAAVADRRNPVSRVLHAALLGVQQTRISRNLLREELVRIASAEMERLHSHLRALEIIGSLSPLLGLLGTVLGMIEAFRQLEEAGSGTNPAILAGGIWQALLTTAAGLGVAIPVVLAHTWLERRVERCGHEMEDAVTRIFTRDLIPCARAPEITEAERIDDAA